ncbi:UNVERIFIED_CONTAM: hypothetical protein FKN15_055248 [Acipenser sinensis]
MKKLAVFVLSMFGFTYICKVAYSTVNAIKTDARNRLCDAANTSLTQFLEYKPRHSLRRGDFID